MREGRGVKAYGAKAWTIWTLGALAFGYAFFQRVAPSVMVSDLMRDFAVGAAVLGNLSALYFYPYVVLQVPLGILTDRIGARIVLSGAMALAAAGTLIFGTAGGIGEAYVGRFLVGMGSAACFIATLSLSSRWFPPHRFAFLAGMCMFFAMAAGVGGQAPLAALIEVTGWRAAMVGSACFAGALALVAAIVVRNRPPDAPPARSAATDWAGLGRDLKLIFLNGEVWLIALVATALSGVMLAFGGLWGVPYMMVRYGLARPEAAALVSLILVGWALGAPFGGWLSDAVKRRKAPLVATSAASCLLAVLLFHGPPLPLVACAVLIVVLGLVGGSMVSTYALAREVTPPGTHATVTGLVNAMTVAAGAVLQPAVGFLLDLNWAGGMAEGARVYTQATYETAFLSIVGWAAMGLVASLFLRETYCRPMVTEAAAG